MYDPITIGVCWGCAWLPFRAIGWQTNNRGSLSMNGTNRGDVVVLPPVVSFPRPDWLITNLSFRGVSEIHA